MANRHDSDHGAPASSQRGFDDGELEHGWAGGIEIDGERPSTALGADAGARKWVLLGLGASCLLAAAFVRLATHTAEPAHAAAIEAPLQPSSEHEGGMIEADPVPSEPVASPVAPSPARPSLAASSPVNSSPSPSPTESTLAAGASAAVQSKPLTSPKPAAAAKPADTPKPAAAPNKPASADTPKPAEPPTPKPVAPTETPKLPAEPSPPTSSAELPDVEGWDAADDEASAPATPS